MTAKDWRLRYSKPNSIANPHSKEPEIADRQPIMGGYMPCSNDGGSERLCQAQPDDLRYWKVVS